MKHNYGNANRSFRYCSNCGLYSSFEYDLHGELLGNDYHVLLNGKIQTLDYDKIGEFRKDCPQYDA